MSQHVKALLFACVAVVSVAAVADAQWNRSDHPSRGVCFYEHPNYDGRYLCASVGRSASMVPLSSNDKISSVRIFGSAEVIVYKDANYRGASHRFTSSMSNLRFAGWGDRISSYRVQDGRDGSYGGGWGGAYGGGSYGRNDGGRNDGWGGAYGGGSKNNWNNKDGGRWTYQEAERIVQRAYRSVLKREPDAGAQSWIGEVMKNSWTQQDLEGKLMQSAEYRNKTRR
jgi:hypothetical protein